MPYVVVGFVIWLLWRYYAKREQQQQALPPQSYQPSPPDKTQPPTPPPQPPAPPPAPATDSWVVVPGSPPVAQPGGTYRASAPAQSALVMMALPSGLAARGFTQITVYKPGEAYPADWPDSGDKLRVQAALPGDAQPQALDVDGITLWKYVPGVGQAVGRAVWDAVQQIGQQVQQAAARYPHPKDFGVYSGLVRRPKG